MRVIALLAVLFSACATTAPSTSSYDETSNMMRYESRKVLLGFRGQSSGLTSGQRVMWQAEAACSGPSCRPDQVDLVFYNESDSNLNVDFRRLVLKFGASQLDFRDGTRDDESKATHVPRGPFFRLSLSIDDFSRLAQSESVKCLFGETGTAEFEVRSQGLGPFRQLVASMNGEPMSAAAWAVWEGT